MKSELREKVVQLRLTHELSYSEIRKRTGVSKSTLSYWLRDLPLSNKRISELRKKGWKKGEAARELYRNSMRKKKVQEYASEYEKAKKRFSHISADAHYIAGLMLYAAEGSKKDPYKISIANTDPKIILFFIDWLQVHCAVSKDDLRFQLHLYESMEIEKEILFWINTLGIQRMQLYKAQIRKLQKASFTYSGSFRHGTCTLYFGSKEKKTLIMASIAAFFDLHTH